jgi:hypothetical protein
VDTSRDHDLPSTQVGCAKLAETNAVVDGLRGELKELAPVLEQKAADAEVMLKQVAVDQAEVRSVSLRRDAAVRAPSRVATRLEIEIETTPGLVRWRRVASMA